MVNKVILIGNLGRDPEIRSTPSGTSVANISLATSYRSKDQQTGEWTEKTEWHRVVLFGRQAEVAGQYLNKGSRIFIEGRLQTRSWEDKQSGEKKYMTEVVGESMKMLGGRGESAGSGYGGGAPSQSEVAEPTTGGPDDDIPF